MADGQFDQTGSGLYTPDAADAAPAHPAEPEASLSDEQLLAQYRAQFEQTVEQYPPGAVMTAFGVGVGLGAVLGASLGALAARRSATAAPSVTSYAEQVGKRLLAQLHEIAPDGVSKYLD